MFSSTKYPYSPHRGDWNFLGGGGFCKTKKFKEMYEAQLEFPEGWGDLGKIPFCGEGMDIFWNYTMMLSIDDALHCKQYNIAHNSPKKPVKRLNVRLDVVHL